MRRSKSRGSDIVPSKSLTQTFRSVSASTRRASTRTPSPSLRTRRLEDHLRVQRLRDLPERPPCSGKLLRARVRHDTDRADARELARHAIGQAGGKERRRRRSLEYSANGSTAMVTIGVARPTDVQRPVRQTPNPTEARARLR